MVSSPLLIVAAAAGKGHLETRSRPITGPGCGSRNPGVGLAGAYGWNRSDSFLRPGSSKALREAKVRMGPAMGARWSGLIGESWMLVNGNCDVDLRSSGSEKKKENYQLIIK